MSNLKIREYARIKDVRLWEIAHALNLSDSNFSRLLRQELPDEKQKEILEIIEKIALNNNRRYNAQQTTL